MNDAVPGGSHGPGDGDGNFPRALASYLAEQALPEWSGVEIVAMERSAGGLSWETYVIEVVDPGRPDHHRRLVVKRPPSEGPLAPYDLTKEGVLVQALGGSPVPVARLLAFTSEPVVAGRQVEVMEFVAGEIPDIRTLEGWPAWQDTDRRRLVGDRVMEVLAGLQSFDWRQPEVSSALRGDRTVVEQVGTVIDRLMGRIDAHVAPRWVASPVARDAWLWLGDNIPDVGPADMVVVHGDFRMGNFVWQDDEVAALLDWERATLGDPMHDLGFFCMPMARQRHPELMGMLMPAGDLVAGYEKATGRPVDLRRLHYYLVYWQYVELAQTLNAIAYLIDRAPVDDVTSLTSYPLISSGTLDLVDLIERYEEGDHAIR